MKAYLMSLLHSDTTQRLLARLVNAYSAFESAATSYTAIVIGSVTCALARFLFPTRNVLTPMASYEALSHVLVGFLIGAFMLSKNPKQFLFLWCAIAISTVELAVFSYSFFAPFNGLLGY